MSQKTPKTVFPTIEQLKKTGTTIYALVYCRVSSERQKKEGHGLESQEHRCREYASQKGYVVAKVFKDSFTGGGDFHHRPELSELLLHVEKTPHKNFVVIIDDLSRFARDVKAHFQLKSELYERGIGLECSNFNFEDSPEGELIETLMAAQHQYHRKSNRRQVIQKQKARLEMGYWAFGSKRGYEQTAHPIHGKISIPTKEGLEILKPALEDFATGVLARKIDVCRFLVEKGFWKKQSPEKYIDKLTAILTDAFYAGHIEYPAWEVTKRKGHHDGIISFETYGLIQKRLRNEGLSKRIRMDITDELPLRGLHICAVCKEHLTGAGSTSRGKRYLYYNCQNKECELYAKMIPSTKLEKDFKELMNKTTLKNDVSGVIHIIFDRTWKSETDTHKQAEMTHKTKIKSLEEQITNLSLLAHKAKSEPIREGYEMQMGQTVTELKALQEQPLISETDLAVPYRNALNKAVGFLKSPYTYWQKLGLQEQHGLFHFIFEQKLPYHAKEGYRNAEELSTARLFEEFVSTNSHDVEMLGIEPRCNRYSSNDSTVIESFEV